ncbi:DUF4342 domain-containing protein [Rhodothermus marinus]|uniref:DUF4342 domain-containing protein n=2 Tax=Rhodothermus marinus TaxID=29549 RepID=D0MD87_RHOM4|nr:DUF4342 domain-containing protein [Rhodothermus marinus]ACY48999.1 hypothetical protein Rmar_2120 [Rhodothermus marinus DSM 4252]BBM70437.1 hypothetical protein RmaAA213_22830 [Rhodothermus marinus]
MAEPRQHFETFKVKGGQLLDRIREIIEEGNARRVILKKDDRVLLEFPLSVGVGGAAAAVLFAPTLAAVGAIAALVSDVDVIIERRPPPPQELPPAEQTSGENAAQSPGN